MAAARQNEMNERRTVVATTTRTRPSRVNGVRDTHAFRVTPAGLADGLGLGSVLRSLSLRPCQAYQARPWFPRALRVAQGLGHPPTIRLKNPENNLSALVCPGGSCEPGGLSAPSEQHSRAGRDAV